MKEKKLLADMKMYVGNVCLMVIHKSNHLNETNIIIDVFKCQISLNKNRFKHTRQYQSE